MLPSHLAIELTATLIDVLSAEEVPQPRCCYSTARMLSRLRGVIDLDPRTNRTYHYWHAFVPGVAAGQIYAYRVAGPLIRSGGFVSTRQSAARPLREVHCSSRGAKPGGRTQPGDNVATALKSVVADPERLRLGG